MITTAGAPALATMKAKKNAPAAQKVRKAVPILLLPTCRQWLTRQLIDAGLIILGKANMTVRLVSGDSSLTS